MSERKPIDRSQFNTPEFHERLKKAAKQAASDPEYQAECKAWDVLAGDGLNTTHRNHHNNNQHPDQ